MSKNKMISVHCQGQFYYTENRNKNFRSYDVELDMPMGEADRALQYIRKNLILDAVKKAYPEFGITGVRTCEIVNNLPVSAGTEGGDVIENLDDVQEDMFDTPDALASDEFGDVGEVVDHG